MHRLSMTQALSIWSDLEAAYYGKNGYGGDTAEIYLYRLMPYEPSVTRCTPNNLEDGSITGNMACEAYDNANKSLHNLLLHFSKERDVKIEVEGKELGAWLRMARFTHRVHVRVVQPAKPKTDPRLVYEINPDVVCPTGNWKMYLSDAIKKAGLDSMTCVSFRANGDKVDVIAHVVEDD